MRVPRVRPTTLLLAFLLSIVAGSGGHGQPFVLLDPSDVTIADGGLAVVAGSLPGNTTEVADLRVGNSTVVNGLTEGHWMYCFELLTNSASGSDHSASFILTDGTGEVVANSTALFISGPGALTVYLDLGSDTLVSPITATESWN